MKLVRWMLVVLFGALVGIGGFLTICGDGLLGSGPTGPILLNWYLQPGFQFFVWSCFGYMACSRVLRLFRTQVPEPPESDLKRVLESAERTPIRKIGEVIYLSWCATVGMAAVIGYIFFRLNVGVHPEPFFGIVRSSVLIAFIASLACFAALAIWLQRREWLILEQHELENVPPGMVIVRPPFRRD